ncbi:hypothetical protein C823_006680 [Eubacterium plexicaudatum ASF492]|uniref:Glycerophosphoryl diester phosphodiesterase membrane domain-containing protein n=1 Tax=Eubacterium plexicaudatum ASF492 TaxID=1235802 RepID=N2A7G8_9FIRM|nr:hypothetical protein C823_006680 [Eubacterium plexicaudatum ASF492]
MTKRSFGELKRFARELLLGNYAVIMLATAISFFVPLILTIPFSIEFTGKLNANIIICFIAAVIIEILGKLLTVGVMQMHLLLAQKQQVAFTDLFRIFRNGPDRFILATMLLYAMLLTPLLLTGAAVYLLMPEQLPAKAAFLVCVFVLFTAVELYLTYVYELIYPLYLEHPDITVLQGFRISRKLMYGNKKRLFLLQLSFLGWTLLGFCSAGVGFLWISPYMTQTTVNFYLDLISGKKEYIVC